MRKAFSAYFYPDGTLIQPFENYQGRKKTGETVDITRGYCAVEIFSKCDPFGHYNRGNRVRGRIVLTTWCNTGFVALARGGKIRAVMPDLDGGTLASRKAGIAIQSVTLVTRQGLELTWNEMPSLSLLSAVFTIEAVAEKLGPLVRGDQWGGLEIGAVKDLRRKHGKG